MMSYNVNVQSIIENYDETNENKMYIVKKIPNENIHYSKYLIKYKKSKLTSDNIDSVGKYRSVIVFKDNKTDQYKIKCFSPPKSSNYNLFIEQNYFNECIITEMVDGTMINLFYDEYSDEWVPCTKSNIGANCKFNLDCQKTFKDMFMDAFEAENLNFDMFQKNYSYSFVMQHPENRIVVPVDKPKLFCTNVYKFNDSDNMIVQDITNEVLNEMQIRKPESFKYDCFMQLFGTAEEGVNEWLELTSICSESILRYDIVGYNIYNKNGMRVKIRNLSYEHVKRLKGNGQKSLFTYLSLRNNDNLYEFMEYFPEYKEQFDEYKNRLYAWTEKLYAYYVACFIEKTSTLKNANYEFKPILYDIQNKYLNELRPNGRKVNFKFIVEYIKKMPVQKIMFSMNYSLRDSKTKELCET